MQFFIAQSGLDTNAGTQSAPFQTIQRAAAVAKAGDVIVIDGSTYRESVKPASDGVIFQGTGTISGADVLTGWQQSPTNPSIWTLANQPTLGVGNDQLFLNGTHLPEARFPKMGSDISRPVKSKIANIISVTQTQVVFTDPAITQADGSWVGASIHLMSGQGWVAVGGTVAAHKGTQLTVSYSPPDVESFAKLWEWPLVGNQYFLYNSPDAFTAPGEWFYSPATKLLSIWLPPGQTPANVTIEAKRRKYGVDLSGRKNCTVSGLNLFACTVLMDKNSASNAVTGNSFKYVSHFTLWAKGWEAPDDSGVSCMGSGNTVSGNLIQFSAGDGVTCNGSNQKVLNNTISDANYAACDAAAVRMPWGNALTCNNNFAKNTGRDCFKFSDCTASEIAYNRAQSAMLQATDGGAFYTDGTDGKGTRIHHNIASDVRGGGFGGAGFYLDNNSSNYLVDHNLAFDCDHGAKTNHNSLNNTLTANTLIGGMHAIDADVLQTFAGTSYVSNILIGPSTRFGTGTVQTRNVTAATFTNPAAGDYHTTLPGVGAFAAGDWTAGPTPIIVGSPIPPPVVTPPVTTPTTQPTVPQMDCFAPRNATAYDAKSGDVKAATNGNQTALAYCNLGNYVVFKAVDFKAGAGKFIATVGGDASVNGKQIELRLDSPTGALIGTLTMQSTGGWWTFAGLSCAVAGASGVRDLVLVFKSAATCNLAAFVFLP